TPGTTTSTPSPVPTPDWSTLVVRRDEQLLPGQSWKTNRITLTMRPNGDFVLYDEHGRARWSAGTAGTGYRALMQGDGNLVVHDRSGRPVWNSGTAGHDGAILCLQADANVTILDQGTAVWSTGTHDRN
ncbi:hypothetical protein ACFPEU_53175, partial [Streptomyces mangrovi]